MAKLVAQTYGSALYELALESNKVDELLAEVTSLRAAFTDGDEFMRFMKHPQVTKEEKEKVIEESLKGKISDDMMGFLVIVAQKGRFTDIEEIFNHYIKLVRELKGIGTAYVETPMSLSEEQKKEVQEKLLSTTKYKEMDIEYSVDPSLIGGMVIRIGDRIVDSSIRSSLLELKKDLQQIQLNNL